MCLACLGCVFSLGRPLLQVYDITLIMSASPRPAGNTQPWVWNVFTFWACYKLSAKTNFAWLGRSLHLAQMLFGSNVFQGLALSIWLSLSDRGSPSQMWTQAKGKACAGVCVCVCTHVFIGHFLWSNAVGTLPICLQYLSPLTWLHLYSIQHKLRGN